MYSPHTVFQFGGRDFVSGLFWQTVSTAKDWKKEARAQAEVQFKDMDLVTFCQLKDPFGVPQIGFASEEGGAKAGSISIAATIGKAIAERFNHSNWIGIFPVDEDFFVFVAVVKDAILPEGDVAGGKSDVLQRFGQEFSQTNQWDAIYAPKSFQIGRAEELSLDDLLPFKGKSIKLRDPSRIVPVRGGLLQPKTLILGAAVVLSVLAALYSWTRGFSPPPIEAVVPEIPKVLVPGTQEPKRIMLPLPWPTQPEPAQVALMCLEAIQKVSPGPGGWDTEAVICTQKGVKYIWKRGASNVKFMLDAVPEVKFEGASDNPGQPSPPNGDRASYTMQRNLPPPNDGEVVSVMSEARIALLSIVQSTDMQGTFQDSPEGEVKNAAGDIEVKTWKNLSFSLTGRIAPWDFVSLASHIRGLRLTRATLTGDQWKLEGDIYGK